MFLADESLQALLGLVRIVQGVCLRPALNLSPLGALDASLAVEKDTLDPMSTVQLPDLQALTTCRCQLPYQATHAA